MALQQLAQTLLLFKADVSDIRAKLKQVTADEKEAVKAAIEGAEKRNQALDKWATALTKASAAVAGVTAVVKIGGDAWKVYEEQSRLAGAAARYNMDRLRQASQGLRTDMELLKVAAGAANTTFALTQEQLETAIKAMRSFEKQGNDIAAVQMAVGKAITEGTIEPLRQFGVVLKPASSEAEKFQQLMKVLAEEARKVEGAQLDSNESFRKAGVEWKNAMDSLKASVGKLVVELQPLVSAVASVTKAVAELISIIPEELLAFLIAAGGAGYAGRRLRGAGAAARAGGHNRVGDAVTTFGWFAGPVGAGAAAGWLAGEQFADWYGDNYQETIVGAAADPRIAALSGRTAELQAGGIAAADAALDRHYRGVARSIAADVAALNALAGVRPGRQRAGGNGRGRRGAGTTFEYEDRGGPGIDLYSYLLSSIPDTAFALGPSGAPGVSDAQLAAAQAGFQRRSLTDDNAELLAMLAEVKQEAALAKAAGAQFDMGERTSFMERHFGPIEQFSAYAAGFELFTASVQAAWQAVITGSGSAMAAFKRAAATSLIGTSMELLGLAAKHSVYAIGSLALGGPIAGLSAAAHGKAAAAAAAGAAFTGGLARALGGGGAGGAPQVGSSSYGGGAPTLTGGGGSMGPVTQVVIVGDVFSDMTNPRRSTEVSRALRQANRELDNYGVQFS